MNFVNLHRAILLIAGVAAVGATLSGNRSIAQSTGPATGAPAAAGPAPASFVKYCSRCHEIAIGAPESEGPNLLGVAGRKAAQSDFPEYSAALANSGLTWTPETLDRYIQSPGGVVPGGTMDFKGLADPAARKEIVDYLVQLH